MLKICVHAWFCQTGMVEDIKDQDYFVSVLHSCRGGWRWPTNKDTCWYKQADIIKEISPPLPINDRGLVQFQEEISNNL